MSQSKIHCNTFMVRNDTTYTCIMCGHQEQGEIPCNKPKRTIQSVNLMEESSHYRKVKQFMQGAKQGTPDKPSIPDEETRLLRARLILEEALETVEALGFSACVEPFGILPSITTGKIVLLPKGQPNLELIIDGCCDLKVVTTGTLIACGIPDEFVQGLVDDNNLDKLARGTLRDDGKLVKPPDHKPPDILGFVKLLEGE